MRVGTPIAETKDKDLPSLSAQGGNLDEIFQNSIKKGKVRLIKFHNGLKSLTKKPQKQKATQKTSTAVILELNSILFIQAPKTFRMLPDIDINSVNYGCSNLNQSSLRSKKLQNPVTVHID